MKMLLGQSEIFFAGPIFYSFSAPLFIFDMVISSSSPTFYAYHTPALIILLLSV